jgi:hypothetical protein
MKNRREFIASAAALTLSSKLYAINHDLLQLKNPIPGAPTAGVALAVSATRKATVPANFVGLSYESQQLADPHFFSASNTGLVAHFKALAPAGILRLGGQTSEYSWWQPTPAATEPIRPERSGYTGSPSGSPSFPISAAAIDNLAKFLHATGWSCIYGLNLGNANAALDTAEAVYVANALGRHLEYFQIGNAVDLFPQNFRDPGSWSSQAYFAEWLAIARAVTEKVPNAKFGGPDVAGHPEWFAAFAASLAATPNPPSVVALSHHYFAGGPPDSSRMTIANLLNSGDLGTKQTIESAALYGTRAASALSAIEPHIALRMVEGNTCFAGGKPGLSDVFASSLWAADYLLHLASLGYAGVNLHGGTANSIAGSIGTELPGELLSPHFNEPRPFYTPIAHTKDGYVAEPVFYGMLFAQQFAGATFVDVAFDPTFTPVNSAPGTIARVNATAYAAIRPDGKTIIAVINKDLTNDLVVHITGAYPASILHLTASAPDATAVTFAHAAVSANGAWTPRPDSAFIYLRRNGPVRVAKASAALFISH